MDNHPQWGFDRQSDTVHYGMAHPNEFQLELPQLDAPAGLDFMQTGRLGQAEFFQFVAHHPQRKRGSEHGHVDDPQQKRQCPDVVLVGMGQHDCRHFGAVGLDIAHVRNHVTHPPPEGLATPHAAVHAEERDRVLEHHHVEANFTQTAERYYFQHRL